MIAVASVATKLFPKKVLTQAPPARAGVFCRDIFIQWQTEVYSAVLTSTITYTTEGIEHTRHTGM